MSCLTFTQVYWHKFLNFILLNINLIDFFDKNPEVLNKFLGTECNTEEIIQFLEKFWSNSYDQRLGQLLLNNELTENGSVWHVEEVDWLIDNGYFKFEELKTLFLANEQ